MKPPIWTAPAWPNWQPVVPPSCAGTIKSKAAEDAARQIAQNITFEQYPAALPA